MTSQQQSSSKFTHYKFLPRSLKLNDRDNTFRSFRVKAFYLKKLLVYPPKDCNLYDLDFSLISQVFRNKKAPKSLCQAHSTSFFKPYVHECFKNSKNLQKYALEYDSDRIPAETIAFALRKLSSKVKSVNFSVYRAIPMDKKDIYDIARSIRRLPKLQSFQRASIEHSADQKTYVQKELAIYSRSVARLKEIKRMTYCMSHREYYGLQRAMRRGSVYKGITGLELFFDRDQGQDDFRALLGVNCDYLFLDFQDMTPNEQEVYIKVKDEIKKKDEAENDDMDWSVKILPDKEDFAKNETVDLGEERKIDSRFKVFCQMREEMKPFFRFELVPDLTELSLTFSDFDYYLASFVIDGFPALTNLENLKITMNRRSKGVAYLFTALFELPLLKKFSLSIIFLNNEEWNSHGHFVRVQKKIEEFYFGIEFASPSRNDYTQKNASIKRTLQYLDNNLSLKSLHLDFPFVSLEALSQALSHLNMMNQLHTFKIKACDDILTSQEKPLKRVEGLCQFIKNQKESLKTLHIDFPLAFDDILVTHIAEAVSQLLKLKELNFQCNFNFQRNQAFDYYQKTLQFRIPPKLQKKLALPEKWNPNFDKYFKKLANLEKFIFSFDIICTEKTDPVGWFVDLVSILPSLENLRTLQIVAAFEGGIFGKEKHVLANQFLCLSRIKNIIVGLSDSERFSFFPRDFNIDKIIEKINERQARKNDYLFY